MIDLSETDLETVKSILQQHVADCEVRVFGSRITGKAEKFSDLDLAIVGKEALDWRTLEALKDAFSISDLPIMVDVVDWYDISESFQDIIKQNYQIIQKPS